MSSLLFLVLACTGDPADTAEPSRSGFEAAATLEEDIPTVAWVRWTTESPGTSWVEYGPTNALGQSTVPGTTEETDHAVLLAGLPPSSTWYWQAVSEIDGERVQSRIMTLDTGVAPRDLPRATVGTFEAGNAMSGYTLTTSLGDASWVIIYNTDGKPVWWKAAPTDTVIAQARLTDNGTAVIYNVAGLNFGNDVGVIKKVRLDYDELAETRTVLGHHDFVELPEGGYAYIAADIREWTDPGSGDTYDVVGDTITVVPDGADDDTPRTAIWSTWDHMDVHVDPEVGNDFYPQGLDWTHCNSLQLQDGHYLLSVRKENAFVKIDADTGEQVWQLGGIGSDYTQTSGRAFEGQHSPELTDAGFVMFDNGDIEAEGAYSEAVEYSLDEAGRTYTPLWSFDYGQRISSYLLGDVERLDNGNTLIAWGSGGTITEVTPEGDIAFQISLAIGSALGFTHHLDALGGVTP